MKGAATTKLPVQIARLALLVLAACALGLLFNAINPDGIPLARSVALAGGR